MPWPCAKAVAAGISRGGGPVGNSGDDGLGGFPSRKLDYSANAFLDRISLRLPTMRARSLPGMLTITPSSPRSMQTRNRRPPMGERR